MSGMPCKLVSETGSGFRKSRKRIKRNTSKIRRRLGKVMLEDAPPKFYRGWVD